MTRRPASGSEQTAAQGPTTVSVVIPAYNAARFLAESLDSIFAQTAPPCEVLVVDDGSTDDTPAVLARYGDRLRVVHGAHAGLSAARNLGLAHARGAWIAFHDADDVALPDRLAFQRTLIDEHPGWDAVFCNGERMDGDTPARLVPPALVRRCSGRPLSPVDVFVGFPVFFQMALVRRATFAHAGPFDTAIRVQPDHEYGFRLFASCTAGFVDRVVFRYRWHDTNMTGDQLSVREDVARILEKVDQANGEAVRLIGRRRLRARLARHYYRIARKRLRMGECEAGRQAARRAVRLRPFHPRYRLLRLRAGF